jgi:branched-chain amino acid transport system ATP-binding protein
MLEVADLAVAYGRTPALHQLDLRVLEGEIVAVIGPNGAGKSTLLKAVFGLVRPSRGTIAFESASLLGVTPERIARRGLALVPEGRHIFHSLTVAENLLLGGVARGRVDRELLEETLDRFPVLRRCFRQPAAMLSGGEQQQLAIGRALLARPRLLLLDEPSLGLAPIVTREVFAAVTKLRERGLTVLLVEQNARQALALADRAYVLSAGRLVMQGSGAALAARADVADAYLGGGAA